MNPVDAYQTINRILSEINPAIYTPIRIATNTGLLCTCLNILDAYLTENPINQVGTGHGNMDKIELLLTGQYTSDASIILSDKSSMLILCNNRFIGYDYLFLDEEADIMLHDRMNSLIDEVKRNRIAEKA